MVSALWKACADGDLERVTDLFNEGSPFDIEVKDHTGITPLICAVQAGKFEIVKLLLDKGADPTNASSHASPEQYTADPAILELLTSKKTLPSSSGLSQDSGYPPDGHVEPHKNYYPPPPGAYYYPGLPVPPPLLPDGSVAFYPPPPPPPAAPHSVDPNANGIGNLPPPDIARMIPCRYYPACRYGSSCLFAHPQSPYLQGPLPPPAQYPTSYDPMTPAPYSGYYSMNPHPFPPPPNSMPANPASPPPAANPPVGGPHPIARVRSGSELVSPVQAPFSPSGVPPPAPYTVVSAVPPGYHHPGPIPLPLSVPSMPPVPPPAPPAQSPQAIFPPISPGGQGHAPPPPHYIVHADPVSQPHYPVHSVGPASAPNGTTSPRSPTHPIHGDGYPPGHVNRDNMSHPRRGGPRRPSFGGINRKPPCLFFPSGRCRNGDDCRFPHVLPEAPMPNATPYFPGRAGHRPRPHTQANGISAVEEKLASLSIQQDGHVNITNGVHATDGLSRSQSAESNSKTRSQQGYRPNHYPNGSRAEKKPVAPKPQRVPSADEFPVLAGSLTPPLRSPGSNGALVNGHSGPTAAQVLQAPAPPRKDKDSPPGSRGGTPDGVTNPTKESSDGIDHIASNVPGEVVGTKHPLSFAAVTTATAPDISKEVSVSA